MSKYIDADEFVKDLDCLCDIVCQYSKKQRYVMCGSCPLGDAFELLDNQPAADVTEVVRCRECVMWDGSFTLNGQKKCRNMTFCTDGDFYCGWGSKE